MTGLIVPLVSRSGLGALASLLILGGIIGGFLFVQKGIAAERKRQHVTEAQRQIYVAEWKNVRSRKRRNRVLSQLPEPDEDLPSEDFIRVSGQSRAALVPPLALPAVVLVLELLLLVWAYAYNPAKPKTPKHHKHHKDAVQPYTFQPLNTNNIQDVRNALVVLFFVSLIIGLAWAAYSVARWGAVYFALSDYRFRRIWVYPSWMFWVTIEPQEVELHMLTTKGHPQNVIGKTFGGFGTLELDTAGESDDEFFNEIPWVPDVASFFEEIASAQRAALPPGEVSENDRLIEAFDRSIDRVIVHFGGSAKYAEPDSTETLEDTGEIPPIT